MLRWKKLPGVKSANSSFDPFKRQEFDHHNQEIYALHKQGVAVYGLSEQRVWGIYTAMHKVSEID
jgi:hypothetical protein